MARRDGPNLAGGTGHGEASDLRAGGLFDVVALREWLGHIVLDAIRRALAEERQRRPAPGEYLPVSEAARIAAVTPSTIRTWIAEERLARYRAGRELRVRRDDLDALLAADGAELPGEPLEPPGPPDPEQEAARVIALAGRRRGDAP